MALTSFDFEQGSDAMQKNYALADCRICYPDSALNVIIETAVQLIMKEGIEVAEGYLQAQGVSRHPTTPSPIADNLCHRPCQAGPR